MNELIKRTLTDNKQFSELIDAVKDLKQPDQPKTNLLASLEVISKDNIQYAKTIAKSDPIEQSYYRPLEFNDVLVTFIFLILLMTIRYSVNKLNQRRK